MRTLRILIKQFPPVPRPALTGRRGRKERAAGFGANKLTPLPREPLWKKFIEKFDEPIIKILLAAALLSMVVDLFKANNVGRRHRARRSGRR